MRSTALKQYFRTAKVSTYAKGEIFIHAGIAPRDIMYVEAGYVKIYTIANDGSNKLITMKGPGDLLPIETLFSKNANTFFYQAMTDITMRRIPRHVFEASITNDIMLSNATLKNTLSVVRGYASRLRNLELKSARERVIYRLLYLVNQFGLPSKDDRHIISVPINYQDLADATNVTRDTANREVSALAKEGFVEKARDLIVIQNIPRLRAELES